MPRRSGTGEGPQTLRGHVHRWKGLRHGRVTMFHRKMHEWPSVAKNDRHSSSRASARGGSEKFARAPNRFATRRALGSTVSNAPRSSRRKVNPNFVESPEKRPARAGSCSVVVNSFLFRLRMFPTESKTTPRAVGNRWYERRARSVHTARRKRN